MIINFNKQFYNLNAIQSAISAYKDLADFHISDNNKIIKLKVDNIDKDIKDILRDEFCNFVLSEIKKHKFL